MPPSPRPFVGEKLLVARTFRDMTQQELATKVSTSTSSLWQLENGVRAPSPDLLQALSEALGFEPAFFQDPFSDEVREDECNFRHRKAASQRAKKRVLAHGSLVVLAVEHLRTCLQLPAYNVPAFPVGTLSSPAAIEMVAEDTRRHWGLALDAPIAHVGRVLENAGVILIRHGAETHTIDAFSRVGRVNIVVLNTIKRSASRSLFDMAHELGHLVMHTRYTPLRTDAEREADRFASAFLMPARAFSREFRTARRLDFPHLFALKQRWRTSLAAIIRRAWDLDLITATQYRYYNQQLRVKGWHRGEPYEPELEKPEVLPLAFETLKRELGKTPLDLARELHWAPETLTEVLDIELPRLPASPRIVQLTPNQQSP